MESFLHSQRVMSEVSPSPSSSTGDSAEVSELRLEYRKLREDSQKSRKAYQLRIKQANRSYQELEKENTRLLRDIAGRPTSVQWEAILKENAAYKEGTMKRRRDNERPRLSQSKAVHVVNELIEILRVNDAQQLISTVKKTTRVLSAIPKLRQFVHAVCDICAQTEEVLSPSSRRSAILLKGLKTRPQRVLPILEDWGSKLIERQSLREMESQCVDMLLTSGEYKNGNDGISEPYGEHLTGETRVHAICKRFILTRVAQLCRESAQNAQVRDAYSWMAKNRVGRSNIEKGLLKHFMELFDCYKVEGILPKMNTVYMRFNEMNTSFRVVKEALSLPANASINDVMQKIEIVMKKATQG